MNPKHTIQKLTLTELIVIEVGAEDGVRTHDLRISLEGSY